MSIDVTTLFNRREDNRWNRVCVSDFVERLTWSTPDKPALIGWEGAYSEERFRTVTFADLDKLTTRIANGLLARGLERGDRVVLVSENSVEGYAFKLGIAKAGMVGVALNPSLAPDVVTHLLERVEPRLVVADVEYWAAYEPAVVASGRQIDIAIEIGGLAPEGATSFGAFVDASSTEEVDATIHGDDIWEILHTSGTTSMPKSAMQSHNSTVLAAHGFALSLTRKLPFESDLKVVAFLPMLYHVGHHIFLLGAFAAGGSVVIGRKPDPAQIAAAIERERATALWAGSPAMLGALGAALDAEPRDVTSLSTAVYGWAQLPPVTLRSLRQHAPDLSVTAIFGQTESISCHRFWPDKWTELWERTSPAQNYVGVPSPLLASRIVDEKGESVEGMPGMAGEAVYRSPVMTSGYYKDEEATAEAFRDGWFHSGDSCLYDNDGLRVMVDRYKDIVKSGGENVSTIRVESVVAQHPGVLKCAVIGVPDDRWGEQVTAVVVPTEENAVNEAELIEFARERLAGFETPKQVIFVHALPETVGGKVMKYRLREQYH